MHFLDDSANTTDSRLNFSIVSAENIINTLDKTKDLTLIRKYRLVLAEQFSGKSEKDNIFTFNADQYQLPSISSNTVLAQYLLVKLLLIILCIILTILVLFILILCFLMRRKYKHKLRTERAIIKTFDLSLITTKYNNNNNNIDSFGYTNRGFINTAEDGGNILSPYIPGTNLYSYEGSNPIWLKKYDKIETISSTIRTSASESESAASTASSYSKTIDNNYKTDNNHRMVQNESKTFYFKQQSDSSKKNSMMNISELDTTTIKECKKKGLNFDPALSITSNESFTASTSCMIKNNKQNDLSSFNIQTSEKLRNCLLNRADSVRYTKKKRLSEETKVKKSGFDAVDLIQLQENVGSDILILNNLSNINKDCADLYALESTVI
jgi:hypothetical protein